MDQDRHRTARQRGAERAEAVVSAWEEAPTPYTTRTRHGAVVLESVTFHSDDQGNAWVEVWAGGQVEGADPHFRVYNPPTLVEDPAGEIEHAGRRWRRDPVAALADTVGQHGGAQVAKTKRRI